MEEILNMKLLIILCALITFSCGSLGESDRSVIGEDKVEQCSRNSRPTFDDHWEYYKGDWKCKCVREWIYPWKQRVECKCKAFKKSDKRMVGSVWNYRKNRWKCKCEQVKKNLEKCLCKRHYKGNMHTVRFEERL